MTDDSIPPDLPISTADELFVKKVCILFLSLLGTILNFLVILVYFITIRRLKNQRKSISNLLLLNQAVTDLVTCTVLCPAFAVYIALERTNEIADGTYSAALELSTYSSLLSFSITALDRCSALSMPLRHHSYVTVPRMVKIICLGWVLSLVPCLGLILVFIQHGVDESYMLECYYRVSTPVQLFVFVCTCIVYMKTYHISRKSVQKTRSQSIRLSKLVSDSNSNSYWLRKNSWLKNYVMSLKRKRSVQQDNSNASNTSGINRKRAAVRRKNAVYPPSTMTISPESAGMTFRNMFGNRQNHLKFSKSKANMYESSIESQTTTMSYEINYPLLLDQSSKKGTETETVKKVEAKVKELEDEKESVDPNSPAEVLLTQQEERISIHHKVEVNQLDNTLHHQSPITMQQTARQQRQLREAQREFWTARRKYRLIKMLALMFSCFR